MRRFVSFAPALLVLVAAVGALLLVPAAARRIAAAQTEARLTLVRQSLDGDDVLERLDRAVRNVAASVEPSVVHVEVADQALGRWSSGSGWVFDDRGRIVTNAHVVRDSAALRLQFADGRRMGATLIGFDSYTDIAVLQAEDARGLFPARRATGERPQKGARVFAFGSPFGYKFSMSEGIISGLGRSARPDAELQFWNFIQTDAAVNPGNSGGPLVDIRGRVIGMNVAIATARETQGAIEGQSAGISFAIPLATIETVARQLIDVGRVTRGFLGVSFQGTQEIFEGDNFRGVGVPVRAVVPDSPAAAAGLKPGDVITEINGESVPDGNIMASVISAAGPRQRIELRLWRDSTFHRYEVELTEMPGGVVSERTVRPALAMLGLVVDEGREGLYVARVGRSTRAEEAGLRRDQRVLRVGETPVLTLADFFDQVAAQGLLRGRTVRLLVAGAGDVEPMEVQIRVAD